MERQSCPLVRAIAHIHLDAIGGVAGDMFIAALLDALPDLVSRVSADLAAVIPADCGSPNFSTGSSGGLAVRRFRLEPPAGHDHGHSHTHDAVDLHHHSAEDHAPAHYRDMVSLIREAPLAAGTADQALAILLHLAEAESRVHGVPLEAVHFHEIADWDSLMDVVASGSIAAALEGVTWSVSDLPRGGGRVRTSHGMMPVPAPATTELLLGFRLCEDGVPGERVTPTGAAILAHLVDPNRAPPNGLRLVATGIGAGTRDLPDRPNILRALVWEAASPRRNGASGRDEIYVLTFDIDDMTGEEIGIAVDHLRAAEGVLDLSLVQRFGKKSRPLTEFRLLVRPAQRAAVTDLCLRETSTLGVRWHAEERRVLARRGNAVGGPTGRMRRKLVERPDGHTTIKVESDDVAGIDGLAARRLAGRHAEETP